MSFPRGALTGTLTVPGDKSISHRALIFQAYALDAVEIENLNEGEDVRATREALQSLRTVLRLRQASVAYAQDDKANVDDVAAHRGKVNADHAGVQRDKANADGKIQIDCMNSGSTARMLLGVCAGANVAARFDGDASLRGRPMEPVAAQLRAFGARIETTDGHLPMEMLGRDEIQTRSFILLSASAQIKSALLFAALFAGTPIDIANDSASRDHTERLLRYQGAAIEWDGSTIAYVSPPTKTLPIAIPGDFSAAAFFIAAATISPGSEITVCGVGVNPTRTGLLDALRLMGAAIETRNERELGGEPVADVTARHGPLRAISIDARLALRAIDEIPLLAIAAAFAEGETRITGIAELRTKESDRVAAIERLLRSVGVTVRPISGGIAIEGGRPRATDSVVETRGDHRIAMGAAVLAAAAGPIAVSEAQSADVSFPGFQKVWRAAIAPAPQIPR